jgi:hypothetical protein
VLWPAVLVLVVTSVALGVLLAPAITELREGGAPQPPAVAAAAVASAAGGADACRVLFGTQNRTFGPYLAAVNAESWQQPVSESRWTSLIEP